MSVSFSFSDSTAGEESRVSLNSEQATTLIIERAKQLVNQLVEDRGHDKPPFLSAEFARLQGIESIVKADLGKISALLLRFHNGYVIKVNQNHPPVRQNFSCAHEIGHLLLGELKLEHYIQSIEYRTFNPQASDKIRARARERLCDAAAAELLMPELVFRKYLSGFGVSIDSVERLANIFRVSRQTAAIRIAEVSPEPCLALLWQSQPNSRSLGLVWCTGPGLSIASKSRIIPKYELVKYPSKLHRAFEQDSLVRCSRSFKHSSDTKPRRLPMESRGFGNNEKGYVISLAFPDR